MDYENTIQHDEINLVRLVRRIEKSAAKEDEWKPRSAEPKEQIWLRVQKSLQVIRMAIAYTSAQVLSVECQICTKIIEEYRG